MNAPDDWNDHINMMNYGFERVRKKQLVEKGELLYYAKVKNGKRAKASVVCGKGYCVPAVDGKCYVTRYKSEVTVVAPLKKGDKVGEVEFYLDDKLIGTVPAILSCNIAEDDTRHFGKSFKKIAKDFLM